MVLGLSLAASLLIGETAIRFFFPRSQWEFRDATSDWIPDKRLGWIQKSHLDVVASTDFGWTGRFQTNEDGLTPPDAQRLKKKGVLRIMIFGDSTVVGRALPQDKTVNVQLENFLRGKNIHAEVINAGVQGYSTDQVFLRIKQLLPLYKPDIVIYGMCDNDFGGNVTRFAYGQPKPMFRLNAEGELVEVPPQIAGPINRFDKGLRKWLQFSALYRFIQPRLLLLRARLGRWEERNLLGLAPEIYYRPEALDKIDWQIFSVLVKEMKKTAEENGARFFFYTHPAVAEVWDPYIRDTERRLALKPGEYNRYTIEKRLQQMAQETKIDFIPLIDYFVKRQSEGPFHLLPRDPHCNPIGSQLTAEVLGRRVMNNLKNKP